MHSSCLRAGTWLLALLALGASPRAAAADEAGDESLRDLMTRMLAEVRMLADKMDRLDKRVAALEARGLAPRPSATSASTPPSPQAATPTLADNTAPFVEPLAAPPVATASPAQDVRNMERASLPSGETRLPDVSPTAPDSLAVPTPTAGATLEGITGPSGTAAGRNGVGYVPSIDKTFVRIDGQPVPTSSPEVEIAAGALFSYAGKDTQGLPQSLSLDFVSTWDGWNAYSDRDVVLYIDNKRYALGEAGFRQEVKDGVTQTTFTIGASQEVVRALAGAAEEVVLTLGAIEFPFPPSALAALQGGSAPAGSAATGTASGSVAGSGAPAASSTSGTGGATGGPLRPHGSAGLVGLKR